VNKSNEITDEFLKGECNGEDQPKYKKHWIKKSHFGK
jgi:hypothetical protein